MADTVKILGQLSPSAGMLSELYLTPPNTYCTISSIVVCNQNETAGTFKIAVAYAGSDDGREQYLYYDQFLESKSTFVITIGITLGATDVVRVSANSPNFSFNAFGIEVS